MKLAVFSQGKNPPKNEDTYGHSDACFVVCDGDTSKKDVLYGGKTGGEIASNLLVETAMASKTNGVELVRELSQKLQEKRVELDATGAGLAFGDVLTCARLSGEKIIITQVGDTAFRINGQKEYTNSPLICDFMASARSQYIKATGDVAGGRDYIMPLLQAEHQYRNNGESPAGYGEINGELVPEKFVHTFTFNQADVHTLEIYTDGYYAVPAAPTIKAFEQLHARIEKEDPDKWKQWLSTKPTDDRTVMIIDFDR